MHKEYVSSQMSLQTRLAYVLKKLLGLYRSGQNVTQVQHGSVEAASTDQARQVWILFYCEHNAGNFSHKVLFKRNVLHIVL